MSELEYTTRVCKKCDEEQHITEFEMNGKYRRHTCTTCIRERQRTSGRDQSGRNREYALKARFGITSKQYDELLKKQDNCCAICKRHESEFKIRLAVDHNHRTREIRGLLCTHCNHRIVGRHTDSALLRNAADYLEQGSGLYVPPEIKPRKRYKRRKKLKE